MNRIIVALAVSATFAASMPALAQGSGTSPTQHAATSSGLDAGKVRGLQEQLNRQGFRAGHVDGLWGPDTAAALRRFQMKKGLPTTGQPDQPTMAALTGTSPPAPVDTASTTPAPTAAPAPTPAPAAPSAPASTTPAPTAAPTAAPATTPGPSTDRALGTNMTGTNMTGTNPTGANADPNAAASDTNQAVTTTNANAPQPAHGANSFSRAEAARRIARNGYANVAALHKDGNGVWRGTATKDGNKVQVWLDYKGNIGQQ